MGTGIGVGYDTIFCCTSPATPRWFPAGGGGLNMAVSDGLGMRVGCASEEEALVLLSLLRLHRAEGVRCWTISETPADRWAWALEVVLELELLEELAARGVLTLALPAEPRAVEW